MVKIKSLYLKMETGSTSDCAENRKSERYWEHLWSQDPSVWHSLTQRFQCKMLT